MSSPNKNPLLLGLVGDGGAGKDFVASFFEDRGFVHFSGSTLVREEIAARGLITSRALQTSVANELRSQKGAAYFVERALDRVNASQPAPERVLLSGIYAPAEGEYIVSQAGGSLVALVASLSETDDFNVRLQRVSGRRDGPRDDMDEAEFLAAHQRENGGVLPVEANVSALIRMSRFTIVNSGLTTPDDIRTQVDTIVEELER